MNFDVEQVITTHRGEPMKESGKTVTYEQLIEACCNLSSETGEKRMQIFRLMLAVAERKAGELLKLSVEQIALVKDIAMKAPLGAVVTGRLVEFLENQGNSKGEANG